MFQRFLDSKFLMNRRLNGGASRFHRKISVSQDRNEKRRRGTLLCFRKYLVWKKLYGSEVLGGGGVGGGGITSSVETFKAHSVEKNS